MAFLNDEEIKKMGFKRIGVHVKISSLASIYKPELIEIDDYSRIDDFCILSAGPGGIKIGRYVHIACYCSLIGESSILLEDFSGLSSRVSLYSSSDDYTGEYMTNPTIPSRFRKVESGPVYLRKHVIVGAGSVILPNITLNIGCGVGALSLVTRSFEPFSIIHGIPARFLKKRNMDILKLESEFLNSKGEII